MMRQDRFTEQAQEVLQASQELVRKARHSQWDVDTCSTRSCSARTGSRARC